MAGPLDQIVQVSITAANATPTLANFGTPAIKCYHAKNTDFIRTYSSLAGLVSDGFAVTDSAYVMAQQLLSQTPTVPSFKVIRGSTSVQQTFTFLVTDTTTGDSVGFALTNASGVTTQLFNTNASQTAIAIATALVALAPAGITLVNGGTATVTGTVTASGAKWFVSGCKGGTFTDTTVTTSPATDFNNALAVDTAWYGVTSEHQSAAEITAVAAWAEANKRLHAYSTADTVALNAASGIGNTLKTSGYTYSFGQWGGNQAQYGALALMAQRFTAVPGTDVWAFKQLAGVTVDALTATQITNATGNNLNYYIAVSGVNITLNGVCASGMYADIRRGIDALQAQIQTQVYLLLLNQPKTPYDPNGIAMCGAEVASALAQFTVNPTRPAALLRNDPGFQPVVNLPLIANTTTVDRSARILRNLTFTAYAQQGIQTVIIAGSVNS